MSIPTGHLTRGQILDMGLEIGGNTSIKIEARRRLTSDLQRLAVEFDWPMLMVDADAFTISGTTFPLPTDFMKPEDEEALEIIQAAGQVVSFSPILHSRKMFQRYVRSRQGATGAVRPEVWTVDTSAGVGRVWPGPETNCTATLRYKQLPTALTPTGNKIDAVYDNDVPWFPWTDFLVETVELFVYEYDKDSRAPQKRIELWGDPNLGVDGKAGRLLAQSNIEDADDGDSLDRSRFTQTFDGRD